MGAPALDRSVGKWRGKGREGGGAQQRGFSRSNHGGESHPRFFAFACWPSPPRFLPAHCRPNQAAANAFKFAAAMARVPVWFTQVFSSRPCLGLRGLMW